jgi:hypothetical protein
MMQTAFVDRATLDISIDFDGSFRHSKVVHVYLDERDHVLRHYDREGGKGRHLQLTLNPPVYVVHTLYFQIAKLSNVY